MHPILFEIFNYPVYSYGTAMVSAFIICISLVLKNRPKEVLSFHNIVDFCLITIASIFFGAKLIHLITTQDFSLSSFLHVTKIWEPGGNAVYWAFLPAFFFISIYCKIKKIPLLLTLDFLFPYTMLALAIQRIFGCFLAGCCYGKPTKLPWGVIFPEISRSGRHYPGIKIHPTQLYYGLSAFLIFVILLLYQKRKREEGFVTALGLILFSLTYFIITFFRGDIRPQGVLYGLTISQYLSVGLFGWGIVLVLIILYRTRKGK